MAAGVASSTLSLAQSKNKGVSAPKDAGASAPKSVTESATKARHQIQARTRQSIATGVIAAASIRILAVVVSGPRFIRHSRSFQPCGWPFDERYESRTEARDHAAR